jgi:RNA polymerase sigma-70 factor (ECF subfamily)
VDTLPAAQAVEVLIQEYGKLVFHTIYSLTGDWEESQDLTQDTFLQALKSIDAARAKSGAEFRPKAWLLSIALNTVRMQRRRRSLFRFIPFSRMERETSSSRPAAEVVDEQAAPVQPRGYGAESQADLEDTLAEQDAVQRALQRLSEPLRVCLLLSIVGQFSTTEIATMLNIEEATVRQRLSRARKQFQQIYARVGGEELYDTSSPSVQNPMSHNSSSTHHYHIERIESHAPNALT